MAIGSAVQIEREYGRRRGRTGYPNCCRCKSRITPRAIYIYCWVLWFCLIFLFVCHCLSFLCWPHCIDCPFLIYVNGVRTHYSRKSRKEWDRGIPIRNTTNQ